MARTKITPPVIDIAQLKLILGWDALWSKYYKDRTSVFLTNWKLEDTPEDNTWTKIAFGGIGRWSGGVGTYSYIPWWWSYYGGFEGYPPIQISYKDWFGYNLYEEPAPAMAVCVGYTDPTNSLEQDYYFKIKVDGEDSDNLSVSLDASAPISDIVPLVDSAIDTEFEADVVNVKEGSIDWYGFTWPGLVIASKTLGPSGNVEVFKPSSGDPLFTTAYLDGEELKISAGLFYGYIMPLKLPYKAQMAYEPEEFVELLERLGVFIAVSEDGNHRAIRSFDNGLNWEICELTADSTWKSICFGRNPDAIEIGYGFPDAIGGGLYVAVADSTVDSEQIAWTVDYGYTWEVLAAPDDHKWVDIAFGRCLVDDEMIPAFIAVANGDSAGDPVLDGIMCCSDPNALSFSTVTPDNPNTYKWVKIKFGEDATTGNGVFVILGFNSDGDPVYGTSYDAGTTWTITAADAYILDWLGIEFGEGAFWITYVGDDAPDPLPHLATLRFQSEVADWAFFADPFESTLGFDISNLTYCGDGMFFGITNLGLNPVSIFLINEATEIKIGAWTGIETGTTPAWVSSAYGNGLVILISAEASNQIARTNGYINSPKARAITV